MDSMFHFSEGKRIGCVILSKSGSVNGLSLLLHPFEIFVGDSEGILF